MRKSAVAEVNMTAGDLVCLVSFLILSSFLELDFHCGRVDTSHLRYTQRMRIHPFGHGGCYLRTAAIEDGKERYVGAPSKRGLFTMTFNNQGRWAAGFDSLTPCSFAREIYRKFLVNCPTVLPLAFWLRRNEQI